MRNRTSSAKKPDEVFLFTAFPSLETAQAFAAQHGLRQRAVAYVTRGARERPELLVFDHTPEYPTAGTQVPAGGLEPGETPLEAALREAFEETGFEGLTPRAYLGSGLYENGLLRQIWHCCWLEANGTSLDAWEHRAEEGEAGEGYTFLCRFEPLETAVLHYDLDAMLPELWAALGYTVKEKALCLVTRGKHELLVFEGHKDGGLQLVRGNLEPGESPAEAAKRELLEEAGLELGEPVSLGVSAYPLARAIAEKYPADHLKRQHLWYYHHFHFTAPPETPDAWTHTVSSGSSDTGRAYHHRFQVLEGIKLGYGMDVGLRTLTPQPPLSPAREGETRAKLEAGVRAPLRPCAVCYITREVAGTLELLTFTGHPWGGVQVIAGGIDPGESPLETALREALEEGGLALTGGTYLGRHDYYVRLEGAAVYEARYAYHFQAPEGLPDAWVHTVSSGEADKGFEFRFQFEALGQVRLDWELGEFLPMLKRNITLDGLEGLKFLQGDK